MNVLFLTDYPREPAGNPGGLGAVARTLAPRIAALPGIDLTVLTCESGIAGEIESFDQGVRCLYIPSPRPRLATRVVRDVRVVARRARELSPDLIHAHLAWYAVAALRTGIPTVWTVHGVTRNQKADWKGLGGKLRGMVYGAVDRRCLERIRHIIAISPYVRETFSPFTAARFHPVENPVEERFFQVRGAGREGRILTVGSIEPRKGTLVLLRAARLLRDRGVPFSLHLVGTSKDDPYHREAQAYVREAGLGDRVVFQGIRTGEALRRAYEEACLCVLASREETAPVTILEAMAAGRPTVATRVGGDPWLVRDGETGFLVEHNDPEALARQMEVLLRDPARRARMGANARQEAEARFRPDHIARQTAGVYREILNGNGASRTRDTKT